MSESAGIPTSASSVAVASAPLSPAAVSTNQQDGGTGATSNMTELPSHVDTLVNTDGLLSEYPFTTQVSYSLMATRVSGTSGLSVLTTPFLSSGAPSIGVLPSQSGQSGVRTTGLDGHRVCWSTSGERPPQLTANPQPTATTQPQPTANPQPAAPYLLGQQVPPINKFSGEDMEGEGDTFLEWAEQFDLIANMCGWNDQARLVNLTTRLRGQAYAFYRTCTPRERSEYTQLKAKLAARFMPV